MKHKKVYLTCGPAGSGKSTWVKKKIEKEGGVWCSRDNVRFSLLEEDDNYFAKEKEVFKKWIKEIQNALNDENGPENIFIDATHLDEKSRNKVLDKLNLSNVNSLIPVNFYTVLGNCLYYNHFRKGRERIPDDVIIDMHKRFSPATNKEKYSYNTIINCINGEVY